MRFERLRYLLFKRGRHRPLTKHVREELGKRAKEILEENIFREGKDSGYTPPSGPIIPPWDNKPHFLYPFQWLWDTFFVAGWMDDTKQGIRDTEIFLKSQRKDGFLGHIRYNREVLAKGEYFPPANIYYKDGKLPEGEIISKITQPPNVAYGVSQLARKITDEREKRKFLKEVFPKIFKYHEYIYQKLVVDGLMVVIHPWQNGDDNSPKWDSIYQKIRSEDLHEKMEKWLGSLKIPYERLDLRLVHHSQRPIDKHYDIYLYLIWLYGKWGWNEKKILEESPFRVVDPLTNAVLLRANKELLEMARYLKRERETEKIAEWLRVTQKGLEKLWDEKEGLYFAVDLTSGNQIGIVTVSNYAPLFSQAIPEEKARRIAGRIRGMAKAHPLSFLVPSTDFEEITIFSPLRYWRGPTWIIMNAIIVDGLIFYGQTEEAKRILEDTLRLVAYQAEGAAKPGFYEYYNPWTGEGLGSPGQSWTAAAVMFLLERAEEVGLTHSG